MILLMLTRVDSEVSDQIVANFIRRNGEVAARWRRCGLPGAICYRKLRTKVRSRKEQHGN